jgi:hypothetical protein
MLRHPLGKAIGKPPSRNLPFNWLYDSIWIQKVSETRKFAELREHGEI